MKDNKLIAKFMDLKSTGLSIFKESDYKYHSSWDWLMPATEKCLITDEPTDGQHYFINDALLTCNIDVVYDRVVEFIKEHNKTI